MKRPEVNIPDSVFARFERMARYTDLPMDYADATLVLVAEVRGSKGIVSFDADFSIFRLPDGSVFNVIQ
jgi:uncharacterized protein